MARPPQVAPEKKMALLTLVWVGWASGGLWLLGGVVVERVRVTRTGRDQSSRC